MNSNSGSTDSSVCCDPGGLRVGVAVTGPVVPSRLRFVDNVEIAFVYRESSILLEDDRRTRNEMMNDILHPPLKHQTPYLLTVHEALQRQIVQARVHPSYPRFRWRGHGVKAARKMCHRQSSTDKIAHLLSLPIGAPYGRSKSIRTLGR